jgi:hypothetical protein
MAKNSSKVSPAVIGTTLAHTCMSAITMAQGSASAADQPIRVIVCAVSWSELVDERELAHAMRPHARAGVDVAAAGYAQRRLVSRV